MNRFVISLTFFLISSIEYLIFHCLLILTNFLLIILGVIHWTHIFFLPTKKDYSDYPIMWSRKYLFTIQPPEKTLKIFQFSSWKWTQEIPVSGFSECLVFKFLKLLWYTESSFYAISWLNISKCTMQSPVSSQFQLFTCDIYNYLSYFKNIIWYGKYGISEVESRVHLIRQFPFSFLSILCPKFWGQWMLGNRIRMKWLSSFFLDVFSWSNYGTCCKFNFS